MFLRALQGYEKAWGQDHTSTLNTVNNLGLLYAKLGRLDEAEKMYLRALQGYEKAWGRDHTSTLRTVHNLGILYADLRRLNEAEKMYLRALQGYEKVWGPDHTSTLSTVNNLGLFYRDRCYMTQKESSISLSDTKTHGRVSAGFLGDMAALEDLCAKYPASCAPSILGRVLIWAGRDGDAIVALQRQLAASYCDDCGVDLTSATGRFVCRTCKDCDLCRACYGTYVEKGLILSESSCQGHRFLPVPVPTEVRTR